MPALRGYRRSRVRWDGGHWDSGRWIPFSAFRESRLSPECSPRMSIGSNRSWPVCLPAREPEPPLDAPPSQWIGDIVPALPTHDWQVPAHRRPPKKVPRLQLQRSSLGRPRERASPTPCRYPVPKPRLPRAAAPWTEMAGRAKRSGRCKFWTSRWIEWRRRDPPGLISKRRQNLARRSKIAYGSLRTRPYWIYRLAYRRNLQYHCRFPPRAVNLWGNCRRQRMIHASSGYDGLETVR
jgi:hypothetical protein